MTFTISVPFLYSFSGYDILCHQSACLSNVHLWKYSWVNFNIWSQRHCQNTLSPLRRSLTSTVQATNVKTFTFLAFVIQQRRSVLTFLELTCEYLKNCLFIGGTTPKRAANSDLRSQFIYFLKSCLTRWTYKRINVDRGSWIRTNVD